MSPVKPQASNKTASPKPPEVVDPGWLFKAVTLSLLAAMACGYATLCFLYYQGSWQLLLHPDHNVSLTPASVKLAYTDVHFDSSETGQPRLTGWWVPAESSSGMQSRYSGFTILYLHDGSGSLSAAVPILVQLHRLGLNVFAIDYRGFGASDASVHPSEGRMSEDAEAAFNYLTGTRHIAVDAIVAYGSGLGASLAANLGATHPRLPAVILDNPDPDPRETASAQTSRLLPARLLLGRPFDVAQKISTLATPKLLIAGGPNSKTSDPDTTRFQSLFKHAASPSFAVTLPFGNTERYEASLRRFLDQYLATRSATIP
jgi:pimeloyl-ACP methyl ester carboxylesterase